MTYRKNVIPARIIITKTQQYITYFPLYFLFFTHTTLFPDLKTPRNTPPHGLCVRSWRNHLLSGVTRASRLPAPTPGTHCTQHITIIIEYMRSNTNDYLIVLRIWDRTPHIQAYYTSILAHTGVRIRGDIISRRLYL